jgi:hypothetical protein
LLSEDIYIYIYIYIYIDTHTHKRNTSKFPCTNDGPPFLASGAVRHCHAYSGVRKRHGFAVVVARSNFVESLHYKFSVPFGKDERFVGLP